MATQCPSKRQLILDAKSQALPNTTASDVGTVVGFKCKTEGWRIQTLHDYVTCREDGTWDKSDPTCTDSIWTEANIIIVSVCCAVGGLIIIGLVALLLWYKCAGRDRSRSRGYRHHKSRTTRIYHQGDTKYLHSGENHYYNGSRGSYESRYSPRSTERQYERHEKYHRETPPSTTQDHHTTTIVDKSAVLPPGPPFVSMNDDPNKPIPSAIIYDPVKQMWIDEYDVRIKIPRPATASSTPIAPWTVDQDMYSIERNPIYE